MEDEDSTPQAARPISPHKADVALILNLIGAMNGLSTRLQSYSQASQGGAMSEQHKERLAMIEQVSASLNSKANRLTALTAGTARFGITDESLATIGRELREVWNGIGQAVSVLDPQQPNDLAP
jgi:hypothetical protein